MKSLRVLKRLLPTIRLQEGKPGPIPGVKTGEKAEPHQKVDSSQQEAINVGQQAGTQQQSGTKKHEASTQQHTGSKDHHQGTQKHETSAQQQTGARKKGEASKQATPKSAGKKPYHEKDYRCYITYSSSYSNIGGSENWGERLETRYPEMDIIQERTNDGDVNVTIKRVEEKPVGQQEKVDVKDLFSDFDKTFKEIENAIDRQFKQILGYEPGQQKESIEHDDKKKLEGESSEPKQEQKKHKTP